MSRLGYLAAPGSAFATEVMRALSALDCDVVILDPPTGGSAAFFADSFPSREVSGDLAADLPLLDALHLDGLVTFAEGWIAWVAEACDALGLPGLGAAAGAAVTDKLAQRRALQSGGVPTPAAAGLTLPAPAVPELAIGTPCVLKPAAGAGGRHTTGHWSQASLSDQISRLNDELAAPQTFVVEEMLTGWGRRPVPHGADYVSVESVVVDGRPRHVGVTGKFDQLPPFRETGQFTPSGLPEDVETSVCDMTGAALAALGVCTGVTHTEIKLTAAGPRVIEVNGRLGGYIGDLYRRAAGFDLVEIACRLALGEHIEPIRNPHTDVAFQYYCQPPIDSVRLLSLRGGRTTRRNPAVAAHRQLIADGSELPGDGRSWDLNLLTGTATSGTDVTATVAEALTDLHFEFVDTNGAVRTCHGQDLMSEHPAMRELSRR